MFLSQIRGCICDEEEMDFVINTIQETMTEEKQIYFYEIYDFVMIENQFYSQNIPYHG